MPSAKDIQAAMVGVSKDELFYVIDQYVHSERDRALMKRRLHDRISVKALCVNSNKQESRAKARLLALRGGVQQENRKRRPASSDNNRIN